MDKWSFIVKEGRVRAIILLSCRENSSHNQSSTLVDGVVDGLELKLKEVRDRCVSKRDPVHWRRLNQRRSLVHLIHKLVLQVTEH